MTVSRFGVELRHKAIESGRVDAGVEVAPHAAVAPLDLVRRRREPRLIGGGEPLVAQRMVGGDRPVVDARESEQEGCDEPGAVATARTVDDDRVRRRGDLRNGLGKAVASDS